MGLGRKAHDRWPRAVRVLDSHTREQAWGASPLVREGKPTFLDAILARVPRTAPLVIGGDSCAAGALAEINEVKGYMLVKLSVAVGAPVEWEFTPLPARPMCREELTADAYSPETFDAAVRFLVSAAPHDAVLSIRVTGELTDAHWRVISSAHLRTYVPATMNVDSVPAARVATPYRRESTAVLAANDQLSF